MWTRCPRQACPHGSLTIKHYRVLVGNHHRGYRSPCIRYTLKKELLLLEQINQWLGVLRTHIEWRLLISQSNVYFTHAWLTWDDSRGSKTNFLKFTAATFTKCTCIRGSHSFHQTNTSWASMKKMLSKVSNTSLMFSKIMEKTRMLSMGTTTIHLGFLLKGIP